MISPFRFESFDQPAKEFKRLANNLKVLLEGKVVIWQSGIFYSDGRPKEKGVYSIIEIEEVMYSDESETPMLMVFSAASARKQGEALLLLSPMDECRISFTTVPNNQVVLSKSIDNTDCKEVCKFTFGEE